MPLLVVHWLALLVFTARVNHNGWLFYQGGDQIWFWTTSWLMRPRLPHRAERLARLALLLVPFTWIGGPGFLGTLRGRCCCRPWSSRQSRSGVCSAGRAHRRPRDRLLGGGDLDARAVRRSPLFVDRYHDSYVDQFLPLPLGLTAMADYTGTVFLLLSAVFTLRAIENRDPGTAAVAGLAAASQPS